MDFNLTVSYDSKNDTVEIMFDNGNNTSNRIVIPRAFYKPFVSILLATGKQMQNDGIDVGFIVDGGDK